MADTFSTAMEQAVKKRAEESTLKGRLRIAMAHAGIAKASDLSRKLRLPPQTVSSWLTGEREALTPKLLFKVADALNVSPRWLALGPPTSLTPPRTLTPQEEEVLQIKQALEGEVRDQWISSGRTMVRHTARRSAANP